MSRRSRLSSVCVDCTRDCSYEAHASLVLGVAYLGNLKLLQHCSCLCGNYLHIRDSLGRTALHVAASKGHLQLVQWLLDNKVQLHTSDLESRWTALHRSVYYGQLGTAALLVKAGGDLRQRDHDNATPLTILNMDRETFSSSLSVGGVSGHSWGSNTNTTLGHDLSGSTPQRLELPDNLSPAQVVLCKFHSVFLSECGRVLTCGHGLGGRLGHGSEQSLVTPCVVRTVEGVAVGVAAARNHTVILTKSGSVYTCGLNDAHQLGLGSNPSTAPSSALLPKHIKSLKAKAVMLVGAGRYHTALATHTEVFTMGKNHGQLGYERNYDTQISPRAIPGVGLDCDDVITQLSASDAATAVLTRRGRVFVCTAYTIKTIRCGFLESRPCRQFSVCASLNDLDHIRKVETEAPKVLLLDSSHDLWVWLPTVRGHTPILLPGLARLKVLQFSLGRHLSIVSRQGEVLSGLAALSKGPLSLERLPGLHNARAIFTDFKSNNFTFTQELYRSPHQPTVSPGTLVEDLVELLDTLSHSVADLEIKAGGQIFRCHRVIVGSVSSKAASLVASDHLLSLSCHQTVIVKAFLRYLYGSHLQLHPPTLVPLDTPTLASPALSDEATPDTSFNEDDLTDLYDTFTQPHKSAMMDELQAPVRVSTPRKKGKPPLQPERGVACTLQLVDTRADLKALLTLASQFGLEHLHTSIKELLSGGRLLNKPHLLHCHIPRLSPSPLYSDLVLVSEEGSTHPCHRCVLVARSDYFRSMLLMGWSESCDGVESLQLPVEEEVLKAILQFIYSDTCPSIENNDCVKWLVRVLIVADQLLLFRLKDLCQLSLSSSLTLRNVPELLEIADTYSASQLKSSCLQFICVNAAALLEARLLDGLDHTLLDALSSAYQSMAPCVTKRAIKLSEPPLDSLPDSYFLEDDGSKVNEEPKEQGPISEPRSSGGRKKRRRKGSQSENKRVESPPPHLATPPPPHLTTPPPLHLATPPPQAASQTTPIASNQSAKTTPQSSNQIKANGTPQSSNQKANNTPQSSNQKSRKCVLKERGVRTRLAWRFNESPSVEGAEVWGKPLSSVEGAAVWGEPLSSNSKSLREIMAREEEHTQQEVTKQKSSSVLISQGDSPLPPPHAHSPVNPWSCNSSPPPRVSLRQLMAEAETAAQRRQAETAAQRQAQCVVPQQQIRGGEQLPPVKVQHQQVSFSSVVHSQKMEQDQQRLTVRKPLKVIQIEERAISELEELYSARDNPDEYITVTALSSSRPHAHWDNVNSR
ncbi:inhibitor of Bruton tyrosine kinase-like isoform X2 [Halichondria panicea]|uniref:inhibitor of Bruton tyrosine kinase-like isoform X2 n=1 Tax=Halichondria panicea TaxID=6063 RepID=UPI00312B4339